MQKRHMTGPRALLVSSAALAISLISSPSRTSVPAPIGLPSPAEFTQLVTISDWLLRSVGVEPGGSRRAFTPNDLAATAPRDFHIFPTPAPTAPLAITASTAPAADPQRSRELDFDVPYAAEITRVATRHAMDRRLIAAIVEIESGFNPRVVSPRGARGLMQVMPATAEEHAQHDLFDPARNLEIGTRYFRTLLARFDGDVSLALAAYNAGPGAVERFGGMPPYRETNRFVEKVLRRYDAHRAVAPEGGLILAAR